MKKPIIQKSQNFIIKGTVFPFDVMFSLGQTDDELYKVLKRLKISDLDANFEKCKLSGTGRCVQMPGNQILVRTKYHPKYESEFGTLAHEIFHAATFIMESAGIEFQMDKSDEAYAYMIGYLTTEVYKKFV